LKNTKKKPQKLLELLQPEKHVFIQTHDFPDHDAVATAFALKHLLEIHEIESRIIYKGNGQKSLQQNSLNEMTKKLSIPLQSADEYALNEHNKIVIVDGAKNNKNVTELIGDEIAIIDHHEVPEPDNVSFVDIRPQYGACSTILFSYYKDLKLDIPRPIATALLIGLLVDTAQMTRGVSAHDVAAYSELYRVADNFFVNDTLRNKIQLKDLEFYKRAMNSIKIQHEIAFCYFPEGCNQTLLAIIGDFFLTLHEVSFVLLCARNGQVINFSLRSEKIQWNAGMIIQKMLKGIGFGGGHQDMAGGIIYDVALFNEIKFYEKLHELLTAKKE
jgi:nanoRNase/pAp phosphatase (c-di-AMP/oligoRNAs hydrolase)